MQISLGHKGKAVYQARYSGENGHSSMAPNYRNAIHVGKIQDGTALNVV